MATPVAVLAKPIAGPTLPKLSWTEVWASDKNGRRIKVHVFGASTGESQGGAYFPEIPVLSLRPDGQPECNIVLRLTSRPTPDRRDLSDLIDGGQLNLTLSLDLGLTPPYQPHFTKNTSCALLAGKTQLATISGTGAGVRLPLRLPLNARLAEQVLKALNGGSSGLTIALALDLHGTASPVSFFHFETSLEQVISPLRAAIEHNGLSILAPNADGSRYETVPNYVTAVRSRAVPGTPERLLVMGAKGAIVPIETALAFRPTVAINAHTLIASDAVRPVAAAPASHLNLALANDIAILPAGQPGQEQLPLVEDATAAVFEDRLNPKHYWYAPAVTFSPPAPGDDPNQSSFAFSYQKTGVSPGPPPRPTLAGNARFVLKLGMSDETKAALTKAGNPAGTPLPLGGLSVTLEVPYTQNGNVTFQSLHGDVQQSGDTLTATISLLDDAVRMTYGSLAYPADFQSQPARLRVAYTYRACVPVPATWPQMVFGGKLALLNPASAARLAASARGMVLLARPQLLAASTAAVNGPRYAVRTIVREQTIDAQLACTKFGSFYLETTNQGKTPIGCTDALKLGEQTIKIYDEVSELRDERYRVYRALAQPARFLVVPSRYRISRFGPNDGDQKAYRPSAMVYSVIDSDPTKNKFFFTATLQPEIPVDARIALEAALLSTTPHDQKPTIEYPTDLSYSSPPKYSWVLPGGIDVPQVQILPGGFSVGLTTGLDNALLLLNLIQQSGVVGAVTFSFEDGSSLQSGLILDTQFTGPWETGPISIQVVPAAATLTNKIERPVNIAKLLTQEGGGVANQTAVNAKLAPGDSKNVPLTQAADTAYCTYSVEETPATLQELNIFVEDVTTNVVFVNQVTLANHNLKALTAQARLKDTTHIYQLPDVSGPSTSLTLTLPLTSYLAGQLLEYQITKLANDGSTSSTDWNQLDLNKSNIVSITWDAISK